MVGGPPNAGLLMSGGLCLEAPSAAPSSALPAAVPLRPRVNPRQAAAATDLARAGAVGPLAEVRVTNQPQVLYTSTGKCTDITCLIRCGLPSRRRTAWRTRTSSRSGCTAPTASRRSRPCPAPSDASGADTPTVLGATTRQSAARDSFKQMFAVLSAVLSNYCRQDP